LITLLCAALFEAVAAQMGEQLLGVGELGHQVGVSEVGDLDVAAAGENQLLQVKNFGAGGDELFEMLEPIPDRNVADGDLARHAGENFPIIVFSHLSLLLSFNLSSGECPVAGATLAGSGERRLNYRPAAPAKNRPGPQTG
jgi:hypothetical protein